MVNSKSSSGGFHYGYVVLIGACLICAVVSGVTLNSAGIFINPVATELEIGFGNLAFYLTILFITMALFLPFAGRMMDKYDVRILAIISVVLAAGSLFAMSKFTSVYQFYVAGFTLGIANTFAMFLIGPILVNRWFKQRVGFYLGIVTAFSGVGAVIANPVGGILISNNGWRNAYMTLSIALAIIGVFASLLLRSRPSDKGLRPLGDTGVETAVKQATLEPGVPASVAVKTAAFFFACFFAAFISLATSGTNQYLAPLAQSYGFPIALAGTVVSICAVGNMIGKPILGAIADKSVFTSIWVACGSGIAALTILMFSGIIGNWSVYVGTFLFGICLASCVPVSAMLVRKLFGTRDYSKIYSNIMAVAAIGSGVGATLLGFVRDFTGGFTAVLILDIVLMAACGIAASIALKQGKSLVFEQEEKAVG
jgi:MFS family permease